MYPGGAIFSTTAKYYSDASGASRREPTPVMDWIERYVEPVGDIQSGGSVATSAFDLLLNLGCSPIILVGQDLAYTGREIHAGGTYHNAGWLTMTSRFLNLDTINQNVVRKRKIKRVEAYGGEGTVVADYVFDLYRGWFEDSALKVNLPVINATEGGARIRNTVERSLQGLVDSLPVLDERPASVLAGYRRGAPLDHGRLLGAIERALETIDVIGARAQAGDEGVLGLVEDEFIAPLYNPFLRKTHSYLARHADLDEERSVRMLVGDIAAASRKLGTMLGRCRRGLAELS